MNIPGPITDLAPSMHYVSVAPVAMNGRADCGDRSMFCDSTTNPYSESYDKSKINLKAPSEFIGYAADNLIRLSVPAKLGKSMGTLQIEAQGGNGISGKISLSCETTEQ